ncbi:MAG: glycosyltransferase [Kiritimatiellales bacterium]
MIISIGVLAWNEEECIATALQSLLDQTLTRELADHAEDRIDVVVVPNGCSDRTDERAAETLRNGAASLPPDRFTWRVESLREPGKVNAWNQFVHRFSNPAADFIFLMDADIRFTHPDTLKNMLRSLKQTALAEAATDLPQKHILFKPRKTIFDRISLAIGQITQTAPAQLTGQLYCARGPLLRRIHMPLGLMVEDGFLKHMICTDLFTQPPDNRRIIRAPNASHVFEAYFRIQDIFNNQRRQQIGHCIYTYLRDCLKSASGKKDAGELIAENNARDPDWFRKVIRERVQQGGWWVIYPGAFSGRFKRLRNLSPGQAVLRFPVAVVAFLMDAIVLLAANHRLRSGQLAGVWKDTKSAVLSQTTTPDLKR